MIQTQRTGLSNVYIAILVVAAALASSCSTTTTSHRPSVAQTVLYESTKLELRPLEGKEGTYTVNLPPPSQSGTTYSRAVLYFTSTTGNRDSIDLTIESSGMRPSVSYRSTFTLPVHNTNEPLTIGLEQGTTLIVYPASVAVAESSPLTLTPFVERINDETVAVGVAAKRNALVEGEYLPSSEDLRVVIFGSGMKTLWDSRNGMAYLTVITPVRPEVVGETSRYSIEWNGTAYDGTPLSAGRYTAQITIPAKPAPYSTSIEFTWPLKK